MWDGIVYYNNGLRKQGRGVATLIKRGIWETMIHSGGDGKCMAIELVKKDHKMIVANIHDPNNEIEKVKFFKRLSTLISGWNYVLIMGDFNVTLTKLDVGISMAFLADKGKEELNRLMDQYKLIDIWRDRYGREKDYSRRQVVQSQIKQSRIDLVLGKRVMERKVKGVFLIRKWDLVIINVCL